MGTSPTYGAQMDNRLLVDVTEITAMQMQCEHCPAQVIIPVEGMKMQIRGFSCPNCGEAMLTKNSDEMESVCGLGLSLRQLAGATIRVKLLVAQPGSA